MIAPTHLAGYLRISVDDTRRAKQRERGLNKADALNAAVERQRDDCRAALDELGWSGEVTWYVDRDVSAFNEDVTRPEFERLLQDLEAGEISHLIVYHPDRLARQHLDIERLLKLYRRQAKTAHFATSTGEIDLRSEDGARRIRYEVDSANAQSAATARRVRRKHRANALDGIPVGGTRPFGWQDDKRSLHPQEAARLRTAVADVLAGKPLASVAVEWQEAGLLTTRGNAWTRASLLKCLINPRLAGYSARNDGSGMQIVRRDDGSPVMGQWEPIVSQEDWEAVCAALAVKRPRPGTGGTVTKYLLSGIARCGVCHAPLRGIPRSRVKGPATYAYLCQSRSAGGCGGVSRSGPKVDEYVTAALLAKMRQEFEAAAVTVDLGPWPGEGDLQEAVEAVAVLKASLSAGKVTPARLDLMDAQVERVSALERERGNYRAAKMAAESRPVAVTREDFDALPFPTRRKYVEDRLAAVVIEPVPADARHGGQFDPTLLGPVWR